MRVLHVITRMIIGGAQENTLYNCRDLMELFDDDVLLATGPSAGPEGELLGRGRAGGVPIRVVPDLQRAINPWRDWRAYRALQRVIREFSPDVVHTHSAKGGFLGRLAAWSQRVPAIIHTVHGAPFHDYQPFLARSLFRRLEKYAAGKCHHLISVADAMTTLMVSSGVATEDKFTTVYSGMDVEPFLAANHHRNEMRAQLGLNDDDVVVGKIARLFHLKGHEYLIDAAHQVCQQCPQAKFLLIGDGVLRDQIESQIVNHGLRDRFILTGLIPPEDIPAHVGAMDILVHTSLREGLARALPQALIAAKPVVSYDVDGAREVTLDRVTGRLLQPRAVQSLATALIELIEVPSLRQTWGREGHARFTDQFRHQTMTRRIREIYQQTLTRDSQ